jgi:integrase
MRGDGRIFQRNGIFWCAYYLNGREFRESTKCADEAGALKFLKGKLKQVHADQIGARTFVTPQSSRLTISELVSGLRTQFELDGKLSASNASELKRIDEDFGTVRAVALTSERIDAYKTQRLAEHAAAATVNRLLTFLIRCYTLAIERKHVVSMPSIKLLKVNNARTGFFNRPEFDKVLENLPEDLHDYCLFGFLTAWRKGEISSLTWSNVHDGVIRLNAGDSKNGEGRSIVIAGELVQVIERRKAARLVGGSVLSNLVFHRDGHPVLEFRKAWATACKKAGFAGRLFHDLRRSGVRNLIRSGVPQFVAMSISGHKTVSMFKRYNVTSEDDLREAMLSVDRYNEATKQKVVSIAQ